MTEDPTPREQPDVQATASGLDETQLAARDIEELRGQFSFKAIELPIETGCSTLGDWDLPNGLRTDQLQRAELGLRESGALRLKPEPLPTKVKTAAVRIEQMRARLTRDLKTALAMPIRRLRTMPADLAPAEYEAVNKAMVAKYGSAVKHLTLQALFREVPAEAAKSVRLDEALRFCQFSLPPATNVARIGPGCALAIATGDSGKTYPALVRL